MSDLPAPVPAKPDAHAKLLGQALNLIRTKGYAATSVDDLCRAAGVTKGAFYHHFAAKDDLAVATARHWSEVTGKVFAAARYNTLEDPLDRVLAYLDFRKTILQGTVAEFSCLVGTMVQETYATSPAIRTACDASMTDHVQRVGSDIALAMQRYGVTGGWTADSLALHMQAVLQGAFILAKMRGGTDVAADSIDHLRRYIALLFNRQPT